METFSPESPRPALLDSARLVSPPVLKRILPLRILKRSDSSCGGPDADIDDHAPRKCSQGTEESRGSAPEPPGGERQLTVPKIRGHRNSHLFGSLEEVDESPVPLGRSAYLPQDRSGYGDHNNSATGALPLELRYSPNNEDSHAIDSFRSRHSPKLRDKAYTKSDVGFRDNFAFLNSTQAVPTAYRPFPRLIEMIQRSRTANSFAGREPPPSPRCDEFVADDSFTFPLQFDEYDLKHSPLLVPIIRATPDTRVVGTGYHNFWVAVEVLADLHRPENEHRSPSEGIIPRSLRSTCSVELDATRHGTLYDLRVEVESTPNSRVLEVVEHEASPKTFLVGSKALILVNVELDSTSNSRLRSHIRSQSNELMEDLENQLGSTQCEYMKVNLIYGHSAFSSSTVMKGDMKYSSGIINSDTKVRTTFTAAINRYNAASPWSPPPAPTPNRLLGIIAAHWGLDAADRLLHDKLTPQRITPRKTTYFSYPKNARECARDFGERASEPLHMISPTRPAPQPPTPPCSRRQLQVQDENRRSAQDGEDYNAGSSDPAIKIWDKIRRCSGISVRHHRRDLSTSTTASVAASVNLPFSPTYGVDSRALRRKKAGAIEGDLMMQRQRLAGMGSKHSLTDRTNLSMADDGGAMSAGKRRSPKGSSNGRRGSGRWGFGNWWLNGS